MDLCSGSGAIGIEALSRGSKKVFFVEKNMACVKLIKKNLEITKLDKRNNFKIICGDAREVVKNLAQQKIFFDIIFLDPPYKTNFAEDSVKQIISFNLLQDNGIIIIETDNIDKVISNLDSTIVNIYDSKKYGRVYLLFLNKII